jgi:hypothetical protein
MPYSVTNGRFCEVWILNLYVLCSHSQLTKTTFLVLLNLEIIVITINIYV